jgi:hypothetical protein
MKYKNMNFIEAVQMAKTLKIRRPTWRPGYYMYLDKGNALRMHADDGEEVPMPNMPDAVAVLDYEIIPEMMTLAEAVANLDASGKIRRLNWDNDVCIKIGCVMSDAFLRESRLCYVRAAANSVDAVAYVPSVDDLLSNDWFVLPNEPSTDDSSVKPYPPVMEGIELQTAEPHCLNCVFCYALFDRREWLCRKYQDIDSCLKELICCDRWAPRTIDELKKETEQ